MKVAVTKTSLRPLLGWAQWILLSGAILMLGYCGFVLANAWIFQKQESRRLERLLDDQRAGQRRQEVESPTPPQSMPAVGPGGLIGRIEIPRLGLSVVLLEGADNATLRRAVGHITGTALPGQRGNVGIAGHRDRFFRPLRNIQHKDMITLTTLRGEYRYRVASTKVVNPDDVAVLDSEGHDILTLVTCYPFYFAGAAPYRFIVRAERVTE